MRRILLLIMVICLFSAVLSGCSFQQQADQKFGDQHFKTIISLVELHKIRFGEYPESLDELKYIGDWDELALRSVSYEKVPGGYDLMLTSGWVGKPTLSYPADFFKGLGLKGTNVVRQK